MRFQPVLNLCVLTDDIAKLVGKDNLNGGVVKHGKFFEVSIPKSVLPKFHEEKFISGTDVRIKVGKDVTHIRLSKSEKFVIRSKKPQGLSALVKKGL